MDSVRPNCYMIWAHLTVNDGKPFAENPEAQDLLALGVKVITGSHPIELLDEGFSLVVKNPGIPYSQPLVQKALEKNSCNHGSGASVSNL